jgi:RNA 3'-terminal phosphate cyclase (ATP)
MALAVVTGTPVRLEKIRAGRAKPGLMRQHLTSVRAAAEVCDGELIGAEPGAQELTFHPGAVRPGDYHFSVGSAGSAMLVLQTALPP